MNCKTCQNVLPDLLLDPQSSGSKAVRTYAEAHAHLAACPACAREFAELQATFALLDSWEAPRVSPYFDQKLAVRLREEQSAPPAGFFERLRDRLQFSTGRQFRPAMAGALALALIIGGGSIGVTTLVHDNGVRASATVNDLQILDRNVQAFQQVDQILQEDGSDDPGPPQS
jgi:anti-sigma factor RsiW